MAPEVDAVVAGGRDRWDLLGPDVQERITADLEALQRHVREIAAATRDLHAQASESTEADEAEEAADPGARADDERPGDG